MRYLLILLCSLMIHLFLSGQVVGHLAGQSPDGAMEMHSDGVRRAAEGLGDYFMFEAFDSGEDEDFGLAFGQFGKRSREFLL